MIRGIATWINASIHKHSEVEITSEKNYEPSQWEWIP